MMSATSGCLMARSVFKVDGYIVMELLIARGQLLLSKPCSKLSLCESVSVEHELDSITKRISSIKSSSIWKPVIPLDLEIARLQAQRQSVQIIHYKCRMAFALWLKICLNPYVNNSPPRPKPNAPSLTQGEWLLFFIHFKQAGKKRPS
jgi:hypothetical protein